MKTTLELDDALAAQVRRTAHRRGWSLKETVTLALRAGLRVVGEGELPRRSMTWTRTKGRLLVDPCDREALSQAMRPER